MYIKLWLCLESGYDTEKIKEIMGTSIAGDILFSERCNVLMEDDIL